MRGFAVAAGQLGENITTRGVDLLGLSANALIRIGASAVVRVTGLRNPCGQIETFSAGSASGRFGPRSSRNRYPGAGIMGVVEEGGWVGPGDTLLVSPSATHTPLKVV